MQDLTEKIVGKGDRRTRRGKIYNGSFGKSRPKNPAEAKSPAAAPKAKAAPAAAAPRRGR